MESLSLSDGTSPVQSALRPKRDFDAHLQSLDSIPLFMKQLPTQEDSNASRTSDLSTSALDALQTLTFDGSPDEVAMNFKKQGNEYFAGRRYTEARSFYTQALEAFPTDVKLQESLLLNRAACNLTLENFGQVLRDCSAVLGLNARSIKAFFRSAKALAALKRFIEAIDCCEHALQLDEANAEVRELHADILNRLEDSKRREAEAKERERRRKEERISLGQAFMSRGLYIRTSPKPPDNPNPAHFDPDALRDTPSDPSIALLDPSTRIPSLVWRAPDPIRTPIVFPTVFFYPQHQQSDLVSHFHEDTTVGDQLAAMFPVSGEQGMLGWDKYKQYRYENLSIFAITHAQRLLRIGKKLTLRETMDLCAQDADKSGNKEKDGLVLQDGILSLVVIPKGSPEKEWVVEFKAQRSRTANVC